MKTNVLIIIFVIALALAAGFFYFSGAQQTNEMLAPDTFKEKLAESPGTIIDVRTSDEFAGGHLQKAEHNFDVLSGEFEAKLDSLDKNETYYLYCRSGNRSGKAKRLMKQNGFSNVYNVGGYQSLVDAGFKSKK